MILILTHQQIIIYHWQENFAPLVVSQRIINFQNQSHKNRTRSNNIKMMILNHLSSFILFVVGSMKKGYLFLFPQVGIPKPISMMNKCSCQAGGCIFVNSILNCLGTFNSIRFTFFRNILCGFIQLSLGNVHDVFLLLKS